ncbi:DNA-directed RNA polymerase, partial [Trifolium pratense]
GVWKGIGLSVGRWFENNIRRKVGDGKNTSFWKDKWFQMKILGTRFPRHFELSVDKNISVADKWRSGWGVGGDCGVIETSDQLLFDCNLVTSYALVEKKNRIFSNQGVSADVLLDKVKTLACGG